MSNTKSNVSADDMKLLEMKREEMPLIQRSLSSVSMKGVNRIYRQASGDINDGNKENVFTNTAVTVRQGKGRFYNRRKSLKLSYDPDRDGGNEYEIEKDTDDKYDDNSLYEIQPDVHVIEEELQPHVRPPTPIVLNQVALVKDTVDGPRENILNQSRSPKSPFVPRDLFLAGTPKESTKITLSDTYTIEKSVTLDSFASSKSKTPEPLNPADKSKQTTSRRDKDIRATSVRTSGQMKDDTAVISQKGLVLKSSNKRQLSTHSLESTGSSVPPANFKRNLFKRIRKLSTPRKTPVFAPSSESKPSTAADTKQRPPLKSKLPGPIFKAGKQPVKRKIERPKSNKSVPTEKTFVKDDSTIRFERVASSESVRSHYDKSRKLEKLDMTFTKKTSLQPRETERFELVDLDSVKPVIHVRKVVKHKPNVDSLAQRNNSVKTVPDTKTSIPPFRVQRVRVKDEYGNSLKYSDHQGANSNIGRQTDAHYGKKINVRPPIRDIRLTDDDSIFSEKDIKNKLLKPQYITEDLKLVKQKVKENNIMLQTLEKERRNSVHRKAILNNFNKTMNDQPNELVEPEKKVQSKPPPKGVGLRNPSVKPPLSGVPYPKIRTEKVASDIDEGPTDKNNRILYNKRRHERKTKRNNAWVENKNTSDTRDTRHGKPQHGNRNGLLHPKIHRFNYNDNDKFERPRLGQRTPISLRDANTTNSVATWVMETSSVVTNGSRPSNQKRLSVDTSKTSVVSIDSRNRPKLKVRLQKKKQKPSENLINAGMYLPIQRKTIKRRQKARQRVFTQVGKVKGYESEIPIIYSDDDDGYPEPRPLTDTERNRYPNYRRYEQENDHMRINYRDPAHKKITRTTGALVRFYRNGDTHDKGVPFTVNKRIKDFESLLITLNDKIPTPTGIRHIYKWPEWYEIKSVTEFVNRCVYVVSSTMTNKSSCFGESGEKHWCNKKLSAGKLRKDEKGLYQKPPSPKESPVRNSPFVVTIINNMSRDKCEKVILNPYTHQTFEEWLHDLCNPDMLVRAIFKEKPPYSQVNSFSQLFRELRNNNTNFIACGNEGLPLEVTKKRQAPSSNSSNESTSESRGRKKKSSKQQEMGQIHENGRPESPSSTAMSRYDLGPRYPPGMRGRHLDSRRTQKDVVEFEIDGTMREFIPPSYMDPEDDGARPDKMLKCEWVYGFRGRDARHNLLVLPKTGELVYYVASIVILYDKERDAQRHYNKHNEEITVMCLHPNQYLIATGQLHGKDPDHASHIRIWHGVTLSTYSVIGLGVFYGGILSVGFSLDGTGGFMVALDGSEKHVLSVWEWQSERIIARTTTTTDPVHCATFYPDGANNSILVTYGAKHIYFWKIFYDAARKKEAKILRDRNSGIFEEGNFADHLIEDVPKSINCLAFLSNGDIVTGDTSGNLMLWDRDSTDAFTCKFVIQAHQSSVSTVCLLDDGTLLSGAGNEIKAWDTNSNFKGVKTRPIPNEAGYIRSIVTQTTGGIDGRVYIGTTNSAILDGSLQMKFRYLVQGHSEGIYGVMPHPFEPTFISAGSDKVVYKWSLITHKVIWRSPVDAPCTSVAVDHRHEFTAIGLAEGTFILMNAYNGMHIASIQVGTEPIGCLAFSPDGLLLAVGCNDGLISIFTIQDRGHSYRKFNTSLRGHNSGVAHLDWSSDGRCIQSVAYDNELIFWDIDSMQQIKIPRMMRDVDWFTNTCQVAYSLIGPWSNLERGEVLRVVNRSNYRDLIVTGDSKGRIRLYKYPCSRVKAEFRNVRIYSSDVTAVSFTPDNRTLLSCGGKDAALVQWEMVEEH